MALFASKKSSFKHHPIKEYEIDKLTDPCAKSSPMMSRSNFGTINHDGDMWFETIFRNCKTGKYRTYFVSCKTGLRYRDEPPTGASAVVYLKYEARQDRLNKKEKE